MLTALVAATGVALALVLALRPAVAGSPPLAWACLAGPYAVMALAALARMRRDGTLREKLLPRSGDVAFGASVAVMLFFGALAARMLIVPPRTAREAWLMNVYLRIGDPDAVQRHVLAYTAAIVLVAALEELTWRGLVYDALERALGTRRAYPATAVLYALAHAPTVVLLSAPWAGPNPLVVLAALGCGLVWGLLVAQSGRLPVAIVSHALFAWALAVQFPLWRLG